MKTFTGIIAALMVVQFLFFGTTVSAVGSPISTEKKCKEVSGEWVKTLSGAVSKCVRTDVKAKADCEAAKGLWILGYNNGENYCELRVDDDGRLITRLTNCNILPDEICGAQDETKMQNSAVWKIVLFVIEILTLGIGILALAGIVYGSVLYSSAGGNPEQVKKARNIILNVVIGVVAYALMYALLQWLVPGGVFN